MKTLFLSLGILCMSVVGFAQETSLTVINNTGVEITVRSGIAAISGCAGAGDTAPVVIADGDEHTFPEIIPGTAHVWRGIFAIENGSMTPSSVLNSSPCIPMPCIGGANISNGFTATWDTGNLCKSVTIQ